MPEVRLEDITKIFDGHVIGLKDFNLKAKDGEFVTILGPSGSGKSTALRIIAGLEKQDKGDVFIDGSNVNKLPPPERDVAFVFQSYALYPHMDVYENIAVGLRLRGYSKGEIQKRVSEVAELLEIKRLLKRRPKALSGGQRQRVALARAIGRRPKVFLLDEPLSNLDAQLREKMRTELKALFKRLNATVIYVTHDQLEAMSLSDKIVLIDNGMVIQTGSPDELYQKPQNLFAASFLGSPRINTFEVDLKGNDFVFGSARWKISPKHWPSLKDMDKLILGIRPEDIEVYSMPKPGAFIAEYIMVEKIGKYAILNIRWEEGILKVLIERDLSLKLKQGNLWVEFDMMKLYLFDKSTGRSLL